jgi:Pheromone A receptor
MAIGAVEVLGTIPLGTYFIVTTAKSGVRPWVSWADTHSNYSTVVQVAGFIWKNDPSVADGLEIYRWSLVVCAFLFFGLFGFADEARQCYRRMYTTLASRIGYSMFTLHGSSHAYVVYHVRPSRPIKTHLSSHLQYFLSPFREEQGWRHCLCRHNNWRQAQIEHLIHRTTFDASHFHRTWQ